MYRITCFALWTVSTSTASPLVSSQLKILLVMIAMNGINYHEDDGQQVFLFQSDSR